MQRGNTASVKEQDYPLESAMAGIAVAMADASRMKMLCALMDGRAWTATELSAVAEIASSTASAHLTKLVNHRLLVCLSQGRHRYYRLATPDIAGLIETLMGVAWQRVPAPASTTPLALRQARTCYDHLAGEVAVAIFQSMMTRGWLVADGSRLTEEGSRQLVQFGVELATRSRRKPCCACLDWSERRFHLGGHAGAALFSALLAKGWLSRTPGYREVIITTRGQRGLTVFFALGGESTPQDGEFN